MVPYSEWSERRKLAAVVTFIAASLAVYFAANWFMHALPTGLVWPFVGIMLAAAFAMLLLGRAQARGEKRDRGHRDRL